MKERGLNKKFNQAYEDYADAIFRHCYFKVSDREKAKDLMQETFIRTWSYIEKGNRLDFKKIRPFLYKTASNLVIDHYRKQKGDVSLDNLREGGFEVRQESDTEESIDVHIEVTRIRKVLKSIDKKYRDVVIMRYIDGLSPKEIAQVTGDTPNNVSVKLNRAKGQVKEKIENEE